MQTENIEQSPENPMMARHIPIKREFTESDRERQRTALWILMMSTVMGVIGNLFFYSQGFGINIVLYVAVFLGGGIGLMRFFEQPISKPNIVFILPALVFAAFLSVLSAPMLVLWNGILVAGSLFLVVRYASTAEFIGGSWFSPLVAAMESSFLGWFDGPFTVIPESSAWFQQRDWDGRQFGATGAVLRGLLLTLPIIILFGLLLGSADVVFGDFLEGSISWLNFTHPEVVINHAMVVGLFAWVCMVGYKLLLMGPIVNNAEGQIVKPIVAEFRREFGFRLGMIETGMILGSVDVLFGLFVIVQARYLFGGEENITAQGYTYSEYARRGFFEILAVSIMTMGLIIVLDYFTSRKQEQENLFRGLAITMIVLTMVLLVAAFLRLGLYEGEFGFTRLRVMTQVFIVWLGVLFAVLVGCLVSKRNEIFWIGCVFVAIGFVGTLNLMNMDGFIASQNVDRFEDTGKLDVDYLLLLSDDAIPSIVPLLAGNNADEEWYETLVSGLGHQLYVLDQDRDERGWLGYHFNKARAWKALDEHRDVLAPYINSRSGYEQY